MNFFSIDCSTDIGSLFVKTKNRSFSKTLQSDKLNNDVLMEQILDFFSEKNLNFVDVDNIFINQGPGNFSGLRGSLATAKGISLSMNLNLFGFDTFIWSCSKFFNKNNVIYCIIYFREKFFIKKFNKKLISISRIKEVTENEILQKFNNQFIVIPRNAAKCLSQKILKLHNLNIVDLDHKNLELLKLNGLLNNNLIKPLYLN
tara:strand:+ start:488 stop:1093 length:606 start_codon:yes stop_codon:yes gene_type:complete